MLIAPALELVPTTAPCGPTQNLDAFNVHERPHELPGATSIYAVYEQDHGLIECQVTRGGSYTPYIDRRVARALINPHVGNIPVELVEIRDLEIFDSGAANHRHGDRHINQPLLALLRRYDYFLKDRVIACVLRNGRRHKASRYERYANSCEYLICIVFQLIVPLPSPCCWSQVIGPPASLWGKYSLMHFLSINLTFTWPEKCSGPRPVSFRPNALP